jgi:hypothetical protein
VGATIKKTDRNVGYMELTENLNRKKMVKK